MSNIYGEKTMHAQKTVQVPASNPPLRKKFIPFLKAEEVPRLSTPEGPLKLDASRSIELPDGKKLILASKPSFSALQAINDLIEAIEEMSGEKKNYRHAEKDPFKPKPPQAKKKKLPDVNESDFDDLFKELGL